LHHSRRAAARSGKPAPPPPDPGSAASLQPYRTAEAAGVAETIAQKAICPCPAFSAPSAVQMMQSRLGEHVRSRVGWSDLHSVRVNAAIERAKTGIRLPASLAASGFTFGYAVTSRRDRSLSAPP